MSDILKSKGNEEFAAKNYERAAQLYGDAATLDPSNPVLYSNKAMALIKLSRWTECIEACDKGLSCQPDNKTKVKLFFRRGSSYSKLNDFHNAIESYQLALKLDSKNTSVLKSIEELKAQESQFKRSRSVDEIKAGKKPKTQSHIERIPIYEVDTLPEEFKSSTETSSQTSNSSSVKSTPKPQPQELTKEIISEHNTRPAYPEKPTVYQLISITKCKDQEKPYAYEYFFSLSSDTYRSLFAGGSIEPALINFILDSIIFAFSQTPESNDFIEKVLSLLSAVSSAPRFSLVGMFSDKRKVFEIKKKLEAHQLDSTMLESIFEKW